MDSPPCSGDVCIEIEIVIEIGFSNSPFFDFDFDLMPDMQFY